MPEQDLITAGERRDLPGCPGYAVGADGTPWTCLRRGAGNVFYPNGEWRKLTPDVGKKGYSRVKICAGGKIQWRLVHHLVLEAFGRPRPPGMECRHKDGDNRNNAVDNLEWTTHVENEADKRRHGTLLMGEEHPRAKFTEEQVREIRSLYSSGSYTQKTLGFIYHAPAITISNIVTRRTWKHVA